MIVLKTTLLLMMLMYVGPKETMKPQIISYIDTYKYVAIDEMVRSGIPASIIIAQGIIESNAGVSYLARESNNHFGIKCKSYWTGHSFYHPDDDRDASGKLIPSCFRKYNTVYESYADHTDFLVSTPHYKALFVYDKTEYEQWARGLQLCGYASCTTYADDLIRIIRQYNLQELDYYTVEYVDRSKLTTSEEVTISQD